MHTHTHTPSWIPKFLWPTGQLLKHVNSPVPPSVWREKRYKHTEEKVGGLSKSLIKVQSAVGPARGRFPSLSSYHHAFNPTRDFPCTLPSLTTPAGGNGRIALVSSKRHPGEESPKATWERWHLTRFVTAITAHGPREENRQRERRVCWERLRVKFAWSTCQEVSVWV